jgi:hypothetical protein
MKTTYLNRRQQSEYCKAKGFKVSPGTLGKLACTGGGPKYIKGFGKALSTPEWMDEWIESRLSEPRRSTSEAA